MTFKLNKNSLTEGYQVRLFLSGDESRCVYIL